MNAYDLAEINRWLWQQPNGHRLKASKRPDAWDKHVWLDIHDGDRLVGSVYRYVSGGWGGKLATRLAGGPDRYINGARPTPLAALQALWSMPTNLILTGQKPPTPRRNKKKTGL